MPAIAVLPAIPPNGPQSPGDATHPSFESTGRDNQLTPPQSVQLLASNGIRLSAHGTAVASVMPYWWDNFDGAWKAIGGDAVLGTGPAPVTVNPAVRNGWSEGRYMGNGEGRFWIVVAESGTAASVDRCDLDAVSR